MGRKLEWELSGKSDVPAKMAEAKKSMEGLDGAANAMSKKFKEAFKDIAVGFLAPVTLIHQAIGFLTAQLERARQFADESRSFAKDVTNSPVVAAGAREALLQSDERAKKQDDARKRLFGEYQGYREFLLGDPRGLKMLRDEMPINQGVLGQLIKNTFGQAAAFAYSVKRPEQEAYATGMALRPEIQKRIEDILAAEAAARPKMPESDVGQAAQKISELSSNVIGVGMSPQLDVANKQLAAQEDMANSLRVLIERDAQQAGFTPNKFWPSARRLNLPR
jgi:hypothetical protein